MQYSRFRQLEHLRLICQLPVSYQGGDDFISGTPTLTPSIASATNTHVYTINTEADTTDEANDTITVTISEDPKKGDRTQDATYLVGSPGSDSITVEDDDAAAGSPVVTIAGDASEVYEGSDAVFTITNAGSSQVNVHYEIAQDGDFLTTTTTDDDDDVPANGTVKITLETEADADDETDGSVTVSLIADTEPTPTYSIGGSYTDSITIKDNDDDALPSVSITFVKENIIEGTDSHAEFTITSTAGTSGPQDGDPLLVDVNVAETGDFLQTAAGTRQDVSITVGTPYTHQEPIVDDGSSEDDGTITATLELKGTPTYGIGASPSATINVSDDEGLPTLVYTATAFTADEGDKPTDGSAATPTVLTLEVGLTTASSSPIEVNYTVGDNSNTNEATNGDDYFQHTDNDGTINFAANSTTPDTIKINVTKDDLYELDEEITVSFTIPSASSSLVQFPTESGGGTTIDSVVGTITNDDTMPSVTIGDAEGLEGDVGGE